ncbi:MAG: hypothetical protein HC905_03995 [Bacteroidales bacterium]|nr:hypothetical protein [Bacteroidales bacterium]
MKINRIRGLFSADLTVKALSKMNKYGNTPLIGSFGVDADGVIPPEEITLIENGILKTLLNDRTPTRMVPQSNGHRRYAYFSNGVSYITGPGVIEVTGKNQSSPEELKKQLIEKAKDEGLDYAIIVKRVDRTMGGFPTEIYKVAVSDGKETLIRPLSNSSLSLSTLRKCIGISNRQTAYNTMLNLGPASGGFGTFIPDISGLPVSFIAPDGILIEEMDLKGLPKNLSLEKPIVPSPLTESL